MAITLNGDTGILSPDFEPSGSTVPSNGLYLPTTNSLGFATNSTERLRLDASGNLGLGVTPSGWSVYKAIQIAYGSSLSAHTAVPITGVGANYFYDGTNYKYLNSNYASRFLVDGYVGGFSWSVAASGTAGNAISFTQAMTLDASGNLGIGTTSPLLAGTHSFVNTSATACSLTIRNTNSSAGAYWRLGPDSTNNFVVYNQNSTGMYMATGGTSWTANSDERLKTDLKPIENAAQKVSTLRAVTGRFKTDAENVSRSFLIAQDVQAVLPEAVDASDPEKLGVRYTDTIPLLVKAIQELTARLEALEGAK